MDLAMYEYEFTFQQVPDEELDEDEMYLPNGMGEIKFKKDDKYIVKWFCFRKGQNNQITMSENQESFQLDILRQFIDNIITNTPARYIRDNEAIFEVENNNFRIDADTMSTGSNLNINLNHRYLEFDLMDEDVKNKLVSTFLEIYQWMENLINTNS